MSVYEDGIFTSKHLREWLWGHVQAVSLILLLVGIRVAFQRFLTSRKASTKGPVGIVLVVFLGAWSEASAQDLRWESFTGVSVNPLGLIQIGTFTASHELYESENPLFATNFVDASAIVASTPAYSIVGAQLQLQPLSILRLRARIEGLGYFGNFDHVQSFEDLDVDFSDSALARNEDHAATVGMRFTGSALLQAKFGKVAVRAHLQAATMTLDLATNKRVFYSPYFDHILESGNWIYVSDADLLWVEERVVVGIRHTAMVAQFSQDLAASDPNGPTHRVGPLIVWKVRDAEGETVDAMNLIFLANWYLVHTNRTGYDTPQWLPYLGIAFSFEGSFL